MRKVVIGLAAALLLSAGAATARDLETAIFAGGCFWCVEADFDKVPGVVETVSGYTGGAVADPSYAQVTAGGTGHREAVKVVYDPAEVSYPELLTAFWHSVDPTDAGGQFCDRGESYTTAIFVANAAQRRAAEASKAEAAGALDAPVVTPIETAGPFYPAEDYHQDYYDKNAVRYRFYRWGCGRNAKVEAIWGSRAYEGIAGRE